MDSVSEEFLSASAKKLKLGVTDEDRDIEVSGIVSSISWQYLQLFPK